MAEKTTFQRELERSTHNLIRIKRDFAELKTQLNLRLDEINKIQK